MTHLFQPRQPIHKEPAFAVTVTAALGLLVLMLLSGCAETELPPTPEEKIKGAWERVWQTSTQTWSFDDGQCQAYSIIEGQPVQFYALSYSFDGDTITMVDLATSGPFRDLHRALVEFPTDSTAVFWWFGGVRYDLKRML